MTTGTGTTNGSSQGGAPMKVRNALSANQLVVTMAGVPVGYVQTITAQEDYSPQGLSGIGDIHIHEWVPTQARYTIAVDRMCLRTQSLMTLIGGAGGNIGSGGLWEDGYRVMEGWVFDIETVSGTVNFPSGTPAFGGPDAPTSPGASVTSGGQSFKKWYQCSYGSGSVRISAHAIVVEDATFYCTRISGTNTVAAATAGNNPNSAATAVGPA